jgi:hypothetical protein
MFLPNKKLWLPGQDSKQPCHKNGYLQSASDARKWRDRFKRNPLAKVADMFVPKPLRMSPGYPCCCGTCSACGDTITSDGTVTWFEHSVNESTGEITRNDLSGDCVTYYVNSVSGGGTETGTGTEDDPWTNLNTVLFDSCIYAICTTEGCPKVKVLVKGIINYRISGRGATYDYNRNLIIEPWSDDPATYPIEIEINAVNRADVLAISNCRGHVFKYVNIICNSEDNASLSKCPSAVGFNYCPESSFDNCVVYCKAYGENTVCRIGNAFGFYNCTSSYFDNCVGSGEGDSGYCFGGGIGFYECNESIYKTCEGYGKASGSSGNLMAFGFRKCVSSAFHNCDGTAGPVAGYCGSGALGCCGFYQNTDSSFLDCTDTNDCGYPTCDSIS